MKKAILHSLLWLFLLLGAQPLAAQSYAYRLKIPYRDGAAWGYCDTLGQIMHPAQYDSLGFFTWANPYAICVQNGKWGLVDSAYRLAIPARYDALKVMPYYEREILEVRSNQRLGLSSMTGETLIPVQYDSIAILPFSEFIIVYQSARLGVYNRSFKPLTEVIYDHCYVSSEESPSSSLLVVQKNILVLKKDSTYSKLMPDGAISPLAANQLPKRNSQVGKLFGRPGYRPASSMSRRDVENNVRSGEFKLSPLRIHYDRLVDNDEIGYYYRLLVQDTKGYALFDLQRGELIPRYYEDIIKVLHFSAGRELWLVKETGKYGIVDEAGNIVLPFDYEGFENVERDHIVIRKSTLKGVFIPYTIYSPIPCQYEKIDLARSFRVNPNWQFGVFAVKKSGKYGFVGENGVEYFR